MPQFYGSQRLFWYLIVAVTLNSASIAVLTYFLVERAKAGSTAVYHFLGLFERCLPAWWKEKRLAAERESVAQLVTSAMGWVLREMNREVAGLRTQTSPNRPRLERVGSLYLSAETSRENVARRLTMAIYLYIGLWMPPLVVRILWFGSQVSGKNSPGKRIADDKQEVFALILVLEICVSIHGRGKRGAGRRLGAAHARGAPRRDADGYCSAGRVAT